MMAYFLLQVHFEVHSNSELDKTKLKLKLNSALKNMMQLIYINILFIVIIFLQNEHMLNRYKLDFIISGFGGL